MKQINAHDWFRWIRRELMRFHILTGVELFFTLSPSIQLYIYIYYNCYTDFGISSYYERQKHRGNFMELPSYCTLYLMFLSQLASRSLRHQMTPSILLRLETEDEGERSSTMLETDPVNLVHMTRVLETALQEMKSGYCRRIARNIK